MLGNDARSHAKTKCTIGAIQPPTTNTLHYAYQQSLISCRPPAPQLPCLFSTTSRRQWMKIFSKIQKNLNQFDSQFALQFAALYFFLHLGRRRRLFLLFVFFVFWHCWKRLWTRKTHENFNFSVSLRFLFFLDLCFFCSYVFSHSTAAAARARLSSISHRDPTLAKWLSSAPHWTRTETFLLKLPL